MYGPMPCHASASMRSSCASSCRGSVPSGPRPEKSHTTMPVAPRRCGGQQATVGTPCRQVHLAFVAAHAGPLLAVEMAEVDGAVGRPLAATLRSGLTASVTGVPSSRYSVTLPPASVLSTNSAPFPAATSSSRPRQASCDNGRPCPVSNQLLLACSVEHQHVATGNECKLLSVAAKAKARWPVQRLVRDATLRLCIGCTGLHVPQPHRAILPCRDQRAPCPCRTRLPVDGHHPPVRACRTATVRHLRHRCVSTALHRRPRPGCANPVTRPDRWESRRREQPALQPGRRQGSCDARRRSPPGIRRGPACAR